MTVSSLRKIRLVAVRSANEIDVDWNVVRWTFWFLMVGAYVMGT